MHKNSQQLLRLRILNLFLFLFLSTPIFFFGCAQDEDRDLRTDLPTEANQLFSLSRLQYESVFIALTSFDEFKDEENLSIPGCPTILIEEEAKRVTLTFDSKEDCEGSDRRTGTIVLDLALQDATDPVWFMEFKDYAFDTDTINGIKSFRQMVQTQVTESFEGLKVKSESQTSFEINGEFSHSINDPFDLGNSLISSQGEINGRNPAGRNVKSTNSQSIISAKSCSLAENNLPISGEEIWVVQRGNSNSVTHTLEYETAGVCETTAKMILPDGRNLILNP